MNDKWVDDSEVVLNGVCDELLALYRFVVDSCDRYYVFHLKDN